MSSERKADLHLEIAHVLFMDVVGFSKLLINDQSEILEQLNQLVRDTQHFREAEAAGKLIGAEGGPDPGRPALQRRDATRRSELRETVRV